MLDGGIWCKKAEIREPRSSCAVEVVCNEMKRDAALLAAFAFAAPPGAPGCGPATVSCVWLGPPPLSVFVHCPGCCDAAAMSTPVFAATWDWGLLGSYVLTVLRIEHERNVPGLGMVNDGELAVFVCWWAAAETDFLLFPKGVRSVHWEAKVRRSSSRYGFPGADADSEQLSLTEQLFDAALGET